MCGICGIWEYGAAEGRVELSLVESMRDEMRHRGPDDEGASIFDEGRGGLGFRRLSIIDLSKAGNQPMHGCTDRVWLVFNGEIYNHARLRERLITGSHTVFYHRYHIVWITKYRYKVLQGKLRERVRDIIRQVCREMGVQIIEGVLSSDHIHMFVSVPPHIAISDLMQRAKGRSSYKIQMEFPEIRKRYWGRRFWARGYFCTTSGNVTDDIILQYIQSHSDKPTDASR